MDHECGSAAAGFNRSNGPACPFLAPAESLLPGRIGVASCANCTLTVCWVTNRKPSKPLHVRPPSRLSLQMLGAETLACTDRPTSPSVLGAMLKLERVALPAVTVMSAVLCTERALKLAAPCGALAWSVAVMLLAPVMPSSSCPSAVKR